MERYSGKYDDVILENDIIPYGDYETLDVEMNYYTESISPILEIGHFGLNAEKLYQEFVDTRSVISTKIVSPRAAHLLGGLTFDELSGMLDEIGFNTENYCAWALRKLGTAELLDEVGTYTSETIGLFGRTFRQQYAMAFVGWKTMLHYDNKNVKTHGYKVHIPLNVDGDFTFVIDGVLKKYKLEVGKAYFVDVTKLHAGENIHDVARVNLTFQMASDDLLRGGKDLVPYYVSLMDE